MALQEEAACSQQQKLLDNLLSDIDQQLPITITEDEDHVSLDVIFCKRAAVVCNKYVEQVFGILAYIYFERDRVTPHKHWKITRNCNHKNTRLRKKT